VSAAEFSEYHTLLVATGNDPAADAAPAANDTEANKTGIAAAFATRYADTRYAGADLHMLANNLIHAMAAYAPETSADTTIVDWQEHLHAAPVRLAAGSLR